MDFSQSETRLTNDVTTLNSSVCVTVHIVALRPFPWLFSLRAQTDLPPCFTPPENIDFWDLIQLNFISTSNCAWNTCWIVGRKLSSFSVPVMMWPISYKKRKREPSRTSNHSCPNMPKYSGHRWEDLQRALCRGKRIRGWQQYVVPTRVVIILLFTPSLWCCLILRRYHNPVARSTTARTKTGTAMVYQICPREFSRVQSETRTLTFRSTSISKAQFNPHQVYSRHVE